MKKLLFIFLFLFISNLIYAQYDSVFLTNGIVIVGELSTQNREEIQIVTSDGLRLLQREMISKVYVDKIEALKIDGVEYVKEASKNELYNRARLWLADVFVSSVDVIQFEDEEKGQLIVKANMKYYPNIYRCSNFSDKRINFTLRIYCKEGRYKYEFENFIHQGSLIGLITTRYECPDPAPRGGCGQKWMDKSWWDIKYNIYQETSNIIADLIKQMQIPAETEIDNW